MAISDASARLTWTKAWCTWTWRDGGRYGLRELDELSLAYATTIHKSQGSEYPAVVMPLSTQHFVLLERNLLYTGVTRGKRLVVVIAQPRARGVGGWARCGRAGAGPT